MGLGLRTHSPIEARKAFHKICARRLVSPEQDLDEGVQPDAVVFYGSELRCEILHHRRRLVFLPVHIAAANVVVKSILLEHCTNVVCACGELERTRLDATKGADLALLTKPNGPATLMFATLGSNCPFLALMAVGIPLLVCTIPLPPPLLTAIGDLAATADLPASLSGECTTC